MSNYTDAVTFLIVNFAAHLWSKEMKQKPEQ